MRECPFCGNEIPDRSRLCIYCGETLGDAADAGAAARKRRQFILTLSAVGVFVVLVIVFSLIATVSSPEETDDGFVPGGYVFSSHTVSGDQTDGGDSRTESGSSAPDSSSSGKKNNGAGKNTKSSSGKDTQPGEASAGSDSGSAETPDSSYSSEPDIGSSSAEQPPESSSAETPPESSSAENPPESSSAETPPESSSSGGGFQPPPDD